MGVVTDAVEVAEKASPIGAFFTSIKLYVTLFVIGAIAAAAFGIHWYIGEEEKKIDALSKQVAAQQVALSQDEQTLKITQNDLAQLKVLTDGYNQKIANIQMTSNKVSQSFNSQQYQSLVKTAPSQAESQINTNINQLFQDVNNASRESIPQ